MFMPGKHTGCAEAHQKEHQVLFLCAALLELIRPDESHFLHLCV